MVSGQTAVISTDSVKLLFTVRTSQCEPALPV